MSHSSQRASRPVTPPRGPDTAPVFRATVQSDQDDSPGSPHTHLPEDAKVPDATPRKVKISSIDLIHKQRGQYTRMADMEMKNRYVQVDLDTFFNDYVPIPTKQLDESQLEKIGDFSHVPYSGAEDAMYAPLVRVTASDCRCCSDGNDLLSLFPSARHSGSFKTRSDRRAPCTTRPTARIGRMQCMT